MERVTSRTREERGCDTRFSDQRTAYGISTKVHAFNGCQTRRSHSTAAQWTDVHWPKFGKILTIMWGRAGLWPCHSCTWRGRPIDLVQCRKEGKLQKSYVLCKCPLQSSLFCCGLWFIGLMLCPKWAGCSSGWQEEGSSVPLITADGQFISQAMEAVSLTWAKDLELRSQITVSAVKETQQRGVFLGSGEFPPKDK